jgi:signal peptidase
LRLRRSVIEDVVIASVGAFLFINLVFGPFYVVVSGSMEPALYPNDIVVVQHVQMNSVSIGDIVVFHVPLENGGCGNEEIVHRVVGFTSNGTLITKGDANTYQDEPYLWPYVGSNCFVGKVVYVIPAVGYIFTALPYELYIVIVIGIIAVILFMEYFLREPNPRIGVRPEQQP